MPARLKLTADALERIRAELAQGSTFTAACHAAGISERSGARYRRRGEKLRSLGRPEGENPQGRLVVLANLADSAVGPKCQAADE